MEARGEGRRMRDSLVRSAAWIAAGWILVMAGCAESKDRAAPSAGSQAGPAEGSSSALEPCEPGAQRECYVTVAIRDRELACYEGVQSCVGAEWGACEDGDVVTRNRSSSWASSAKSGFLALSAPTDCVDNPCNPRCQTYTEVPAPEPLVPQGDPPEGLIGGLPSDAPAQVDCYWGNDCQYNYRCDAPMSDATCLHHKCEVGSALGGCRTNDPCVEAICDASEDCCDVAWSDACVDMVHSVCDSFCVEETIPCTHHVCTVGGAITCNDPCVEAICAQNPACCNTAWSAACVSLAASTAECSPTLPAGGVAGLQDFAAFCGYAAYSETSLAIGQNADGTGLIGAAGDMVITGARLSSVQLAVGGNLVIDNAEVTGNVLVEGSVELRNDAELTQGDGASAPPVVLTAGGVIIGNNATLSGDVYSPAPPTGGGAASFPAGDHHPYTDGVTVDAPTLALATPAECASIQVVPPPTEGGVYDLAPTAESANPNQAYQSLTIDDTRQLRLRAGRYVFESLTLSADSDMAVTYGAAGVDIHVCKSLTLGNRISITQPSTFTGLRWFYYGTTELRIDAQDATGAHPVPGVFIAPNATISVAPNTTLFGVVYANSLRFEPGVSSLPEGYEATMCAATSAPVCNAGIQLAPTPTPRNAGECVPWELGATDEQCSGFDLGLAMPCAGTLVVCNHGTAEAPAGVELALFDSTGAMPADVPSATPANDGYAGSCFTTRPVPPGGCIDQRCEPGLLEQARDVVAIPPAGETECSGIENWTHYDPAVACVCVLTEILASAVDAGECTVSFPGVLAADLEGVGWEQADGVVARLVRAADVASCPSGELGYYVNGSNVILCPGACDAMVGEPTTTVQAIGACPGSAFAVTHYTEVYEAICSQEGTAPQWDLLMWSSSTPHDSSIGFEVRTALTSAALAGAAYAVAGTASSAVDSAGNDTQICDAFTGREDCPVVLPLLALEGDWEMPQLRHPFLELRITLDPGMLLYGNDEIPELESWDLTYSCLDSE